MSCFDPSLNYLKRATFVGWASLACLAQAQEFSADSSVTELEDYVVQGDTLGRTQAQIAYSTTILASNLDEVIIGTMPDEIFARGANTAIIGGGGFSTYTIRGIADFQLTPLFSTGSNGLSTVFVNQVPISPSFMSYVTPSAWDTESVEIFKGPQSVYQGPNSLAGAVFYNFKAPDFDHSGRAKAEIGEDGYYVFALAQNAVLVDEKLAARFTFESVDYKGTLQNLTRGEDDYGNRDEVTLRGQLLWQLDNGGSVKLLYQYSEDLGNNNPFTGGVGPILDRTSEADAPDNWPTYSNLVSIIAEIPINETWSLSSVTGGWQIDQAAFFDGDYSAFPFISVGSYINEKQFTQELKARYNGESLALAIGAYGSYGEYNPGFAGEFLGAPIRSDTLEEGMTLALFTSVDYQLTEQLVLGGGLRLNYEERDVSSTSVAADFSTGMVISGGAEGSSEFQDLIPAFNLRYFVDDNHTIGALVARGYRSGGTVVAPFVIQSEQFDAEYTWNYELFYRGAFLDGRLILNANVFYTDWTDQQVAEDVPGGIPGFDQTIVNVGESSIQGFELELAWTLTDEWSVDFAVGMADSEFKEYILNRSVDPMTGQEIIIDLNGEAFPFSPKWNASATVSYEGDSGWYGSTTWLYRDESYSDTGGFSDPFTGLRATTNPTTLDERHLVNAKIGYERDWWNVYMFATNLFDEDYVAIKAENVPVDPSVNTIIGVPGESRIVGVGFEANW